MRRLAVIILSALMILFLYACGSESSHSQHETTFSTIDAEESTVSAEVPIQVDLVEPQVPVLDFFALLEEFSAKHKALVESNTALNSIDQYLVTDPETVDLLTESEIMELLSHGSAAKSLTYEEAAYDVHIRNAARTMREDIFQWLR